MLHEFQVDRSKHFSEEDIQMTNRHIHEKMFNITNYYGNEKINTVIFYLMTMMMVIIYTKKKKDEITGVERMWRKENSVNC